MRIRRRISHWTEWKSLFARVERLRRLHMWRASGFQVLVIWEVPVEASIKVEELKILSWLMRWSRTWWQRNVRGGGRDGRRDSQAFWRKPWNLDDLLIQSVIFREVMTSHQSEDMCRFWFPRWSRPGCGFSGYVNHRYHTQSIFFLSFVVDSFFIMEEIEISCNHTVVTFLHPLASAITCDLRVCHFCNSRNVYVSALCSEHCRTWTLCSSIVLRVAVGADERLNVCLFVEHLYSVRIEYSLFEVKYGLKIDEWKSVICTWNVQPHR